VPVTADDRPQAAVGDDRAGVLYIRPGVDEDGLARATVDSFARLDGDRWASHLILTEPSPNRRLHQVEPLAEEILDLPAQTSGAAFPELILSFLESRRIGLLSVAGSRLGFDLLPDIVGLADAPAVVAHFAAGEPGPSAYVDYVTRRYGDLVDAYLLTDERTRLAVAGNEIPPSRIEVVPSDPGDAVLRQGELFERLAARRRAGAAGPTAGTKEKTAPVPAGASLRLPRKSPPERTVSVGVPCFRHGIYLDECIGSIKLQFLRPEHIVVVDDGSDDPETLEALERWDADPSVTVLRQPANLGPSAARNRALEVFDTNYALWIDADDQLLPGALDSMIAKLEQAPENVGFVYPHAKHMGSRSDYVETPAYDLWLQTGRDACPSPSMYDMRVFDGTGVSFSEDIVTGHESWDLTLQLAQRGIAGQPADGPTFLYRKRGFSRFQAFDRGRDRRRALEARESDEAVDWMPLETRPLCRHLHLDQSTRVITNDRNPPPGFRLELDLGVTHVFALPGARRLVARAGTFELSDEQDELSEGLGLGYVEDRPFPLCECLELCEMPESGERVLVAGPEDPLHGIARPIAVLGWVQAFPLQSRGDLPREEPPPRAVAIYRRIENESGKHRYAVGLPDGESQSVPIGSLFSAPGSDLVALRRLEDGRLATELATAGRPTRDPRKLARWVARSPASDTGPYRSPAARARSLVRHRLARRSGEDRALTLGWLKAEGSPGVRPLFSATHPVTGDQLVTRSPQEACAYGYALDGLLGYVIP
jgi:glycosyl transferase family 2